MDSRLNMLNGHFDAQPTFNARAVQPKHDDDIVIVSTARTAMTRAKKGAQRNSPPEIMLEPVMRDALKKAGLQGSQLGEICIGNVLQGGSGAATGRMGQFFADIPASVPFYAINRMCSSGLQAVMNVANAIRAGEIDIGMGGGVESMSLNPMQNMVDPSTLADKVFEHPEAQKCLMPMGITSENIVEKYNISRQTQDQLAVESHEKAANA